MSKTFAIRLCALLMGLLMAAGALSACSLITGGPAVVLTDPVTDPATEPDTTSAETSEELTSEITTAEEIATEPEKTLPETTEEVTTEAETTEEITTETPWNLVLVNPWYPLSEEYKFELTAVRGDSYFVDSRCADAVKQMLADCRAAGYTPYICSAFRKWEDQVNLFEKKVTSYINKGYSEADARVLAAKEVAVPGTSEHQLGLAVDILDTNRPWLDEGQADMPTQQWLMANCHKYGFILRYPKGTTDITGIIYEPWHYRYVGVEIATEIMTRGITLEEYLGKVGAPETSAEVTSNE